MNNQSIQDRVEVQKLNALFKSVPLSEDLFLTEDDIINGCYIEEISIPYSYKDLEFAENVETEDEDSVIDQRIQSGVAYATFKNCPTIKSADISIGQLSGAILSRFCKLKRKQPKLHHRISLVYHLPYNCAVRTNICQYPAFSKSTIPSLPVPISSQPFFKKILTSVAVVKHAVETPLPSAQRANLIQKENFCRTNSIPCELTTHVNRQDQIKHAYSGVQFYIVSRMLLLQLYIVRIFVAEIQLVDVLYTLLQIGIIVEEREKRGLPKVKIKN